MFKNRTHLFSDHQESRLSGGFTIVFQRGRLNRLPMWRSETLGLTPHFRELLTGLHTVATRKKNTLIPTFYGPKPTQFGHKFIPHSEVGQSM